jgi:putative transposase
VVKPSAKRKMVDYLAKKHKASLNKVCQTIQLHRSTYYHKSCRDDSEIEEKLNNLAAEFPTRGFDWYYQKIRTEGLIWNRKRVLRIYRNLGLSLRRKHKKRLQRPYENAINQPIMANVTWSMDFVSDQLEDGRKVRVLVVIDDYNREVLALEVGLSIPGARVVRVLQRLFSERGKPFSIRTDNGPEFICKNMAQLCAQQAIEQWFIQPGKPYQNGFVERLNRTYREDVLDAYIFESIDQLQRYSMQWKSTYNHGHPHQSLNGQSPVAFKYARHKIIDAYEKVKAKMNGSLPSPALTYSPPSMVERLRAI